MANIAINNYCNLKCKYCFADDMIQEKSMSITLEDYRKILSFLSRTPENHVGIIGGEPTLHPDFENILKETNKYCKQCNTTATLFTNGINLDSFLPYIGERIGVLINCNSPEFMKPEYWKSTIELFDHLDSLSWFDDKPNGPAKANIGCNVYPGLTDYSYIWEIVDKYHIPHLRTSVVSPGGIYWDMRQDKEKYYSIMKPIFINHCKNAIKHKCILHMDCGHIPECYFSVEELEIVKKACDRLESNHFCEPVIDIKANFKAYSCFGQSDEEVDMRDFNDIHELRRYMLANITFPNAKLNCTGKCTTCKKHELLQCQGGCLSFARAQKSHC
jgi:hypothetical protein